MAVQFTQGHLSEETRALKENQTLKSTHILNAQKSGAGTKEGLTSDIPLKAGAHGDSRLEDAGPGQASVSWTINLELSSHFDKMLSSAFAIVLPLFSPPR